ncbi:MAG: UvrD-helicase domain-containing protein [bacterium]
MDLLNGLNDRQKEAVLATEGPVMVIAGAGSGKTKVLTHRIAYIINDLGISPRNILAVTFTNKAAAEMKNRVSSLLDMDTKNMWISTFHSFGAKVLRREIHHIGHKRDFTILDSDDSLKEIKLVCKNYNFTEFEPKDLQCHISNHKNEMEVGLPERSMDAFLRIYDCYEKHLLDNNLLDFDDLIVKTLQLFRNSITVLEKYSSMFNYVMIDEFQDTNKTQYELVLLLSSYNNNVFIVGDQDQSIYSFRGALVSNINQFRDDFKKTKLILLEQNYRSTQNILDAANKIIKSNTNRIDKNLFTEKKDGEDLIIKCLDSSYGEASFLTKEIKYLLRQGYLYKDIAIIYRLNSLSRGYEDEFIKQNIPYQIYGGLSYFSRKEVKDIIAYLRLICNFDDNFSLRRIINVPKRGVGEASVKLIEKEAVGSSMFNVLHTTKLSAKVKSEVLNLRNVICELSDKIEEVELKDFVKEVIEKTGYAKMLKDADEEERLDNVMELRSVLLDISEFYEGTNKEKLEAFLLDLALKTDTDNVNDDDNKVKLMSYHQAKGLEFKVVFMTAMEQDIFPSQRSVTPLEREEEIRICYVGITRAMEKLYLTHCESRRLYGKDSYMSKSMFLNKLSVEKQQQKYTYYNEPTKAVHDYKMNDIVEHKSWGRGTVVLVNGDNLTIAFDVTIGIKVLKAGHPSYSRIEE